MSSFRSSPFRQSGDVQITGSQNVSGKIVINDDGDAATIDALHLRSEITTPSAPADGDGGILYVKSDGKVYWRSYELSETDLTTGGGGGGGGGISLTDLSAGTGISYDNSTGVISMADTAVVTGIYGEAGKSARLTVDQQGRITNIEEVVITGSGGAQVGTIGNPEDGTYTDGLFTDFTSTTSIGTSIDRINEVLKILAPSPAPDLSSISENVTDGIAAKLSFGSSQAISDYSSSANNAGFDPVDINSVYQSETSGSNIRLGIYDGTQDVTGILNDAVAASISNGYYAYVADAFGNGEVGTLKLELNGVVIHSVDLSTALGTGSAGSGTGNSLTNDSGFTNFSTTASSFDGNGAEWNIFKHRTSRYKVDANSMHSGWNYIRVIHTIGSSDKTTNYIEWINDPSGSVNNLAATNPRIEDVTLIGSKYLSGVQYNTDATANYKTDLENMYQNVYQQSGNPISFTVTNSSTPSNQSVPSIDYASGEDSTKIIGITASLDVNTNSLLSGAITANITATHPLKSTLSNGGSATTGNGFLIDNRTLSSTNLVEYFHDETYRKTSGSYADQASTIAGASIWDSTNHMTSSGATGHEDGLLYYNQRLYSPVDSDIPVGGNFSALSNVESGQPDYSGVSGTRTFYRVLTNSSGVTKRDIKITTSKSSTTFNNSSLSTSNAHLYIKIPGATGWMDASQTFTYGSIEDGDGALIAGASNDVDSNNNVHHLTFGTASVGNGERLMIKLEADESWQGYISQMSFQLGASINTANQAPALDDFDSNQSGVNDAKLSFGSSNVISGYSSVTGSSIGSSNYDSNTNFPLSGDRRGVFNTYGTISGELNEDVGSDTSYSANSFGDAFSGSLVLEVNGVEVHSIDISSTLNAITNNFNSNGSGFSVSAVSFSDTSDNIPDYTKPYRTGTYQIGTSDQNLGWNYARVIHRTATDTTTNYIEWVLDTDSTNLLSSSLNLSDFDHDNKFYQSGVGYFASRPSASYSYTVSNAYKNVYQNGNAISFPTTTNCSVNNIKISGTGVTTLNTANSSSPLAELDNTANCQDQDVHVTGTVLYDNITSIVEDAGFFSDYAITVSSRVIHPFKSTINTTSLSKDKFMFYSGSIGSTSLATNEYFNMETYRLVSASYDTQNSVTNSSNAWNSSISMNDNGTYPEYAEGLAFMNGYLLSPINIGSAGDTRNVADGGDLQAPSGNPDYRSASLTISTRNLYRYFQNNSTSDRASITIKLYGTGNLVKRATSLGANGNFYLDAKIPGSTAWLDVGTAYGSNDPNTDGAGALDGAAAGNPAISISNSGRSVVCNFNGQSLLGTISGAQYVVLRIVADKQWTGNLTRIEVSYS